MTGGDAPNMQQTDTVITAVRSARHKTDSIEKKE